MENTERILTSQPKYAELLGPEQAKRLLKLFAEIENGKYDKNEVHEFRLNNLKHPVYIRAIRADMQSFTNTFIDPYLERKAYLSEAAKVIDAGANIGYTAALFSNWWPNAEIVSIEPDAENYQLTLKNTTEYKNVTVIHAGLWTKEASLKIEAGQEDGFVVREVKGEEMPLRSENLTTGISIEQIMKQKKWSHIDFLKMNIEGSEKEIFTENYSAWLPHTKAMLIELHDGKNQGCSRAVFSATNTTNFAVAETAPYGVLFVKENIYRTLYANWYREEIYKPNINKDRFPEFYLDREIQAGKSSR